MLGQDLDRGCFKPLGGVRAIVDPGPGDRLHLAVRIQDVTIQAQDVGNAHEPTVRPGEQMPRGDDHAIAQLYPLGGDVGQQIRDLTRHQASFGGEGEDVIPPHNLLNGLARSIP